MDNYEKKQYIKKIIITSFILLLIGGILITLTLLFSQRYDLLGWINALFFSGFLIFTFGWMMYVSNANLFTVMIFGVKQFILGLFNRTPAQDIIEYRDSRKSVPTYIIILTFIIGLIFIIISLTIYFLSR